MTQKQKAEAYDKAIAKAQKELQTCGSTDCDAARQIYRFFPELKESEDERIRKAIITFFESEDDNTTYALVPKKDILAWLEKQGNVNALIQEAAEKSYTEGMRVERKRWLEKQGEKPTLPKWRYKEDNTPLLRDSIILNKYGCVLKSPSGAVVSDAWVLDYDELAKLPKEELDKQEEKKPIVDGILTAINCNELFQNYKIHKFNVGDFIVNDYCFGKVIEITNDAYLLDTGQGIPFSCEHNAHIWTIKDAKDGDVLVCNINKAEIGGDIEKLPNITPTICVYQNVIKDKDYIHTYCSLYNGSSLVLSNSMYYNTFVYNIQPATKEQRNLLFQKMHEAGYEWSDKDRKLIKIVK